MNEIPQWYLLLKYWCRNRKRYGLTIPFVIGSIGDINIKELLLDISNKKCPEYILLRYCWDLQEYILSIDESLFSFSDSYKRFDNLLIYDDFGKVEEFNSIDDLSFFFENRYRKCILEKKFSLESKNHEWVDFTEADNWRLKLI